MIHKIQVDPTVQKYKLLPNIPYCCVNGHTLCLNIIMPDNRPPSGAPINPDGLPASDTRFPLLIYLAGGGFRFTDPFSWLPMLTYFCERGYIVATVDYRCSGESRFPAAIQDVKCAIRFLRKNAYEYEIDPTKITLMGDSAGGYLAVMTGATNGNPKFETEEYQEYSSCKVSGVSLSNTSTAFWRTIGPASHSSETKCTVAPLTFTPYSRAFSWTWSP